MKLKTITNNLINKKISYDVNFNKYTCRKFKYLALLQNI